ncbi:hypothetical protein ADN00_11415 [Ornatilinea apprima]|uniref:4-vinyl reductase 4VR domain-containing protein n=1 Tax=Ornatilinea apprima TaxID=1134406 RepID=A0A0P6X4K1_9CHLR|nr:hypothetical protein ADN00_11415 [Ornatilinea apprima]
MIARLSALRLLVGHPGMLAILRRAGLTDSLAGLLVNNWEKTFPYAAYQKIIAAVREIYGERGYRALAYRAGKNSFAETFGGLPAVKTAKEQLAQMGDERLRLHLAMQTLAEAMEGTSIQRVEVSLRGLSASLRVDFCFECWDSPLTHEPICYGLVGSARGALAYLLGRDDYLVREVHCTAAGDDFCELEIKPPPEAMRGRGLGQTGFLTLPPDLRAGVDEDTQEQ